MKDATGKLLVVLKWIQCGTQQDILGRLKLNNFLVFELIGTGCAYNEAEGELLNVMKPENHKEGRRIFQPKPKFVERINKAVYDEGGKTRVFAPVVD